MKILVLIFMAFAIATSAIAQEKTYQVTPASSDSTVYKAKRVRKPAKGSESIVYTGKRGGKYTVNANGKKRYLKKK